MRIAYLIGHYPAVSHTFILREVQGLRSREVEIETISIHRVGEDDLPTEDERRESASTYTILPPRWRDLIRAHCSAFFRSPAAYLSTLALALRLSRPGLRGRVWQLFYFAEAMVVWRRCRALGIHHLHAHFTNQVTDAALLVTHYAGGARKGWTWSFTVHGPDEFYEVSRFNLRAKIERADFVVCISDFARSQLMALVGKEHWEKLSVIHCGIDPEVFAPPARREGSGSFEVLCVGRLVPFKGQGLLIEAIAELARRGVAAKATIVGAGSARPGLEALAAKLGISDQITFTGALGQDEIRGYFEAADAFCLPSFAEGVPVSLMEAMAMELPVVSSRLMGIPELVEDGVNGMLTAPGKVAELTDALERLAREPELRRSLGQAGRERVIERYAIDDSTEQLHALFSERVAAPEPAGRDEPPAAAEPAEPDERTSYRASLGIGTLSFLLLVAIGLVSAVATARIYGIEVIGQFALVMAPVNAIWYLSTVSEQVALIRELAVLAPREPRVTGLFAAIFAFSFALTAVVGAIAIVATYFVFSGPIGHPELFAPALVSMIGYAVITNTGWNYDSLLTAFRAARQLFWIRLNQLVTFLAVAVGAGLALDTVWGLVIATLASYLAGLVHRVIAARSFMRTRVPREEIRKGFHALPRLIKFGIKIAPGSFADGLSNEAGTWVLGIYSSVAAVGAYSRAWTLGRRFVDMTWRITEMLYPTLVERRATQDHAGFDRAWIDSIRYATIGMLLPAAAGGGAAHGIMAIFGPGFTRASGALALILLMPAMFTVISIQRRALFSVERPTVTTISAIGRMLVTLALSVPLTIRFDETGTALALVLGLTVDLIYMSWTAHRHLSQPLRRLWSYRQMLAIPVAYCCGFAAARFAYLSLPGIFGLIAGLAAGSVAFAAAVVLAGGLNARDRQRLGLAVDLLRRTRLARLTPQAGT